MAKANWSRGLFRLCFLAAFVVAAGMFAAMAIQEGMDDLLTYWYKVIAFFAMAYILTLIPLLVLYSIGNWVARGFRAKHSENSEKR